jgi:hypothetical protein
LDADHDDTPLRYRQLSEMLGPGSPLGRAKRIIHQEPMVVKGEEPATFSQTEGDQAQQQAMKEEMDSVEENQSWKLVDSPDGPKPIGVKWVYKPKKDAHGSIVNHKARLVAKGYVHKEGVDFEEVFAPVAKLDPVRLLLVLVSQEGWKVHHMDVKSAFLNGELMEKVYVSQPPSFAVKGQEHKAYKMNKALYRLKQTPRP